MLARPSLLLIRILTPQTPPQILLVGYWLEQFVMFRGAGEPSLFLLPFVEPVVSTETVFFYSVFRGQAASGW